ncbi:choice-of-anchor Q domain-containing protein [Bacteroides sp. HPS0048]|uniref:T9SS type A sorting domain-containing protein n=1 Tax=Bacteroides sp. HPS0048 TaxID=1078089 RepID=UPI00356ADD7D
MKKSTLILLAALFTANLSAEERVVTSLAGDAETEGSFRQVMNSLENGDIVTFNIPEGDEILLEGQSGCPKAVGNIYVIDGINKATGNRITFRSVGDPFPFFKGLDGATASKMDITFRNIIVKEFNNTGNGAGFALGNSKTATEGDTENYATFRLINSEVSDCLINAPESGKASGCAIFNGRGVDVIIDQCVFSNNEIIYPEALIGTKLAQGGAVIATTGNNNGSFLISNSTFYGNKINVGRGGAIYAGYPVTLINCTIAGNSGEMGGGFYAHNDQPMILINSIFYQNISTGTDLSGEDVRRNNGSFQIYNCLVGSANESEGAAEKGFTFEGNNNITVIPGVMKVFENDAAPELKDNGGNTLTVALHATQSMAAKAGIATAPAGIDVTIPTVDQRGYTRAAKPCMGAFELGGIEPVGIQTATADAKFNYSVEKGRLVIAESGECRIFNMLGAKITELTINGSAPINLESGIYIVRFMNEAGTSVAKVLIP